MMKIPEEFKGRLYVTKDMIVNNLKNLGLREGSIVVFHSSLRSIGYVEGGANTVIEGFLEAVGNEGTVMVPSFSFNFADVEGAKPFHPAKSESRVGLITDTFWRRADAIRSKHPTHSVAAIGKYAEYLTSNHENTSAFGKKSPWGKIIKLNGYVMLLGVGFNVCSFFHAAEDILDLPYYNIEREALIEDDHGVIHRVRVPRSPEGHRDFYREPKKDSKVKIRLMKTNIIKRGFVGEAQVFMARSMDLIKTLYEIIREEPDIFLCDNEGCEFCRESKKKLEGWKPPPIDLILDSL